MPCTVRAPPLYPLLLDRHVGCYAKPLSQLLVALQHLPKMVELR